MPKLFIMHEDCGRSSAIAGGVVSGGEIILSPTEPLALLAWQINIKAEYAQQSPRQDSQRDNCWQNRFTDRHDDSYQRSQQYRRRGRVSAAVSHADVAELICLAGRFTIRTERRPSSRLSFSESWPWVCGQVSVLYPSYPSTHHPPGYFRSQPRAKWIRSVCLGSTFMSIGFICRFSRRNGINAWSWLFETLVCTVNSLG
jgi:hypothetical protein